MSHTRMCCALAAAGATLVHPAVAGAQNAPSFAPLTGASACVVGVMPAASGTGCTPAKGMAHAIDITLSRDDRFVYAASHDSIVTFARAADTGALTFASCISDLGDDGRMGTDGACADGDALNGLRDLAISPDGHFVYASAQWSNSVVWLARDPQTGALTPSGCLKAAPRADRCGSALNLTAPGGLAVSPDGSTVYVASSFDAAVSVFRRDAETGALTPGGCVSDSGSDGRCVNANALSAPQDVAVSPDGTTVYVSAARFGPFGDAMHAVTAFLRDGRTGELTPSSCLLAAPVDTSPCAAVPSIGDVSDLAVAPNGQLITAGGSTWAVSVLTAGLGPVGCYRHQDPEGDDRENVTEPDDEDEGDDGSAAREQQQPSQATSSCTPVKSLANVAALALSGDGTALFTTSGFGSVTAFRRDPASARSRSSAASSPTRSTSPASP